MTHGREVSRTETHRNGSYNSDHTYSVYCYVVTWTMDLVELLDNIHTNTDTPNPGAGAHSASYVEHLLKKSTSHVLINYMPKTNPIYTSKATTHWSNAA